MNPGDHCAAAPAEGRPFPDGRLPPTAQQDCEVEAIDPAIPIQVLWFEGWASSIIGESPLDDTRAAFSRAWTRVKFPRGPSSMAEIVRRADAAATPTGADYDSLPALLLLKICRELQRQTGDGPFFLSVRKGEELVGISHNHVWNLLQLFKDDGFIRMERKGNKTRATRFRYIAAD